MGVPSNSHIFLFHFLAALFEACFAQNITSNFIFGDSLVDCGNNNYIVSLAKANYVPNGIDFGQPTGRFTNGRTVLDIIGQELGFRDFTPPYLAPTTTGDVFLRGVNYASAGSGIFNHTGNIFGGRINLDAQLDNFANTRQDIILKLGTPTAASTFLEKAFFYFVIGSNDFLDNYLTSIKQKLISPETFVDLMISRYRRQLTRIYSLDARKIVVANIGPIGCIPVQRGTNPLAGDLCVVSSNDLAKLFNNRLKRLLVELNLNLVGSQVVYADVYRIVDDIIQNFPSYGFEDSSSACCYGGLLPCGPGSEVCEDRSKHVFWDEAHPSEAANLIIAKRLLDGDTNDIYPVNIRNLFQS